MSYEIIKKVQTADGFNRVVLSDGNDFFVMSACADGTYSRKAGDMTLQTRDFDYAAIGAEKCKALETAIKWAERTPDDASRYEYLN
jgi:hypothetical protein